MTIAADIARGLRQTPVGGGPGLIAQLDFAAASDPTLSSLDLTDVYLAQLSVYMHNVDLDDTHVSMRVSDDNGVSWGGITDYENMLQMTFSIAGGSQPQERGAKPYGTIAQISKGGERFYAGASPEGGTFYVDFYDPGNPTVNRKNALTEVVYKSSEKTNAAHWGSGGFSRIGVGAIDAIQLYNGGQGRLFTGSMWLEGWTL